MKIIVQLFFNLIKLKIHIRQLYRHLDGGLILVSRHTCIFMIQDLQEEKDENKLKIKFEMSSPDKELPVGQPETVLQVFIP